MIQPNELRMGNLVSWDLNGENIPGEVLRILEMACTIKDTRFHDHLISFTYNEIFPIPINREWVKKLGFKLSTWHERVEVWAHPDHIPDLVCIDGEKWLHSHDDDLDSVELNSVHQLQNLFFALTGQELKLTT